MIYDCIVIGAGASGLFFAAVRNRPVNGLILERTGMAGTKLLISGNGRCNITHSGSIKDFIPRYGKNGRLIRRCLYKYSNSSLIDFLESGGIKTVTRDDGKVFPFSMRAADIRDFLLKKASENGFKIKYRVSPKCISKVSEGWSVLTDKGSFTGKVLIIAAGGCSYPSTGSDGSIFPVLTKHLGLSVTDLTPALCSVVPEDYPYGGLSGISFENVRISAFRGEKKTGENTGALLFTERSLSGPAILDLSGSLKKGDTLNINYLYPLSYEEALEKLKKIERESSGSLPSVIREAAGLPSRFCRSLSDRYGPSLKMTASCLTGEKFTVKNLSGFQKAMVTRGGIALSEIDTSSMELKRFPGLFAVGEVCDIDGATGGYNLQFAYSSAGAAACGAEKYMD
ncbi:MAG TPA: aminoacetone oxidase family FAD-binding enzyme [Candidatus Copromorpha excrementigallinarum]|uniref:Aminoacetone oxidase family FAD-binding enzyme n=1 Tax=Candidatus Allocopromorpha excrementigallinarum TaxID=2840742 RepID=A0A9D1L7B3_9FIRM|nr:aminoacetone oxidase family FAD-binding enzyme [Candidatus Copromorpha excrementigallinarum]